MKVKLKRHIIVNPKNEVLCSVSGSWVWKSLDSIESVLDYMTFKSVDNAVTFMQEHDIKVSYTTGTITLKVKLET